MNQRTKVLGAYHITSARIRDYKLYIVDLSPMELATRTQRVIKKRAVLLKIPPNMHRQDKTPVNNNTYFIFLIIGSMTAQRKPTYKKFERLVPMFKALKK